MKFVLLVLVLSVFSYNKGFSQNWSEVIKNDALTITVKEIHHQDVTNGMDHQRWVFKYENHTPFPIRVVFNRELVYNGKPYLQDETFSVEIPANGVVEYDQSHNKDKTYYIFKSDNNNWIKDSLDTFKIINFNIK